MVSRQSAWTMREPKQEGIVEMPRDHLVQRVARTQGELQGCCCLSSWAEEMAQGHSDMMTCKLSLLLEL